MESHKPKCKPYTRREPRPRRTSLYLHLCSSLMQDMKNATISLNSSESEPKHYPVEVLLKGQNQELPEDVDPAKKEVSGCVTEHGGGVPMGEALAWSRSVSLQELKGPLSY